jgi:conjugative coupling factor TraD (TOL family)
MSYPKEVYLRPPVEWISSICLVSLAVGLVSVPRWLLIAPALAWSAFPALLLFAAIRFRQGLKIVRYQKNLRRLPKYEISAGELPVSDKRLFLGMGFEWTARHTQRLHDARDPANERYVRQSWLYLLAREFEIKHEGSKWAQSIIKTLNAEHWGNKNRFLNPLRPLPPVGGDTVIHGVEPLEKMVSMDLLERSGHTLVLGTTRVGKTRLAETFIAQDIRRGDVVIVFDPKGDAELLKRMYAEAARCGREADFIFFHLGYPDISARYNPVGSFGRITEVATRIAGQLPNEGQSAAFKEFVWRFVNVMAKALVALGHKPNYKVIYENAVNIDGLCQQYFEAWLNREHPDWREDFEQSIGNLSQKVESQIKKTGRAAQALYLSAYAAEKGWSDPVADSLASILSNDRSYFEKLVSSLYPLLEKLTTGKTASLLSPDYLDLSDRRSIFDWMSVINEGKIVYVGLDSLSDYEVAGAVGNAMFADLTSIAGQIYKHGQAFGQSQGTKTRKTIIHADEFNELIGDEFIPLLNKAGGAGFQVTVYTQTWSDVEAKIGSAAKAGQIGGNLNTLFMLRVKTAETAEIFTNQLPEVKVISTTIDSSATDTNDPHDFAEFGSKNQDRISSETVPMMTPADFVRLPKGQCMALIEGGRVMKLRLPLFKSEIDVFMPADLDRIAKEMQALYTRSNTEMDEDLLVEGGV